MNRTGSRVGMIAMAGMLLLSGGLVVADTTVDIPEAVIELYADWGVSEETLMKQSYDDLSSGEIAALWIVRNDEDGRAALSKVIYGTLSDVRRETGEESVSTVIAGTVYRVTEFVPEEADEE